MTIEMTSFSNKLTKFKTDDQEQELMTIPEVKLSKIKDISGGRRQRYGWLLTLVDSQEEP